MSFLQNIGIPGWLMNVVIVALCIAAVFVIEFVVLLPIVVFKKIIYRRRKRYFQKFAQDYPLCISILAKKHSIRLEEFDSFIKNKKAFRTLRREIDHKTIKEFDVEERRLKHLLDYTSDFRSHYPKAYLSFLSSRGIVSYSVYVINSGYQSIPKVNNWKDIDDLYAIPKSMWLENEQKENEKYIERSYAKLKSSCPLLFDRIVWEYYLSKNLLKSNECSIEQYNFITKNVDEEFSFEDKEQVVNNSQNNDYCRKEQLLEKVNKISSSCDNALAEYIRIKNYRRKILDSLVIGNDKFSGNLWGCDNYWCVFTLLPWDVIEDIVSRDIELWQNEENIIRREIANIVEIEKQEKQIDLTQSQAPDSNNYQILKTTLSPETILRNRVSLWSKILYGKLPHRYLVDYYPVRYTNLSIKADNDRKRIWRFKDGNIAEQNSFVFELKSLLSTWFLQSDFPSLTFVCVPASTKETNRIRYQNFSEMLCSKLKMINAYNHITITKDGTPKHTGGGSLASYYINSSFFKNKNVILFDDVLTSGSSMKKWKEKLEGYGAHIICAITLGKTV